MRELEERYEGYKVYDNAGERIGKVDDLFVDESGREEYIGVKSGFFGLKSTLIPMDIARVDDRERVIEVSEPKDRVKDAPNFDDDEDITPEYEERVRRHFGLGDDMESSGERGSYGRYAGATASGAVGATPAEDRRDEDRDLVGRESYRNREETGSTMESAGTAGGADAIRPSGGMEGLETGDWETGGRGSMTDEGYREGYREGFREGYREGVHEGGGRGEPGDLEDTGPSRSMGDEAREMSPRSSEEGRREEGGRTRVWQRLQR
jgi:hypothetical protein